MFSFFHEKINPLFSSFYNTITVLTKESQELVRQCFSKGVLGPAASAPSGNWFQIQTRRTNANPQTHSIKNSIFRSPLWVSDTHSGPRTTRCRGAFLISRLISYLVSGFWNQVVFKQTTMSRSHSRDNDSDVRVSGEMKQNRLPVGNKFSRKKINDLF